MATDRVKIDQMAHVIMEGLQEYADLATDDMKAAVKKAGNEAKKDVQDGAPVKPDAIKKAGRSRPQRKTQIPWKLPCIPKTDTRSPICLNLVMRNVVVVGQELFRISHRLSRKQRNCWRKKWRRH